MSAPTHGAAAAGSSHNTCTLRLLAGAGSATGTDDDGAMRMSTMAPMVGREWLRIKGHLGAACGPLVVPHQRRLRSRAGQTIFSPACVILRIGS